MGVVVVQPASRDVHDDVPGFLVRAGLVQQPVLRHPGGERMVFVVGGRSGLRAHACGTFCRQSGTRCKHDSSHTRAAFLLLRPGRPAMQPDYMEPVRIQKLIAEAGICSRRAAEALIVAGAVYVNGAKTPLAPKSEPRTHNGTPPRQPPPAHA